MFSTRRHILNTLGYFTKQHVVLVNLTNYMVRASKASRESYHLSLSAPAELSNSNT